MESKRSRKTIGKAAFSIPSKRVALFKQAKIIKIFPSLSLAAKKYYTSPSVLSRGFEENRHFDFLDVNENLKIISESEYIKQEILLFKRHIRYLLNRGKIVFNCDRCLKIKNETLPISTFSVYGNCTQCNVNENVSCGAINNWLIKNNYDLKLTDRSKFLREFMPFEYAEKAIFENALHDCSKDEKLHEIGIPVEKVFNGNISGNKILGDQKKISMDEQSKLPVKNNFFKKTTFKYIIQYVVFFVILGLVLGLVFKVIIDSNLESNKIHHVKAIILEKDSKNEFIIYKNIQGDIFKIPNALQFWDCGNVGDSIRVSFKSNDKPIFTNVELLK